MFGDNKNSYFRVISFDYILRWVTFADIWGIEKSQNSNKQLTEILLYYECSYKKKIF